MSNLYQVLEVDNTASTQDIKNSYRKLAKKLHPDRNANNPLSTEKFKKVSEAYSVLSDPQRRQEYDNELRFTAGKGYGGTQGGFTGGGGASMDDILRQFTGARSTYNNKVFVNFTNSKTHSRSRFNNFQDILRTLMQQDAYSEFSKQRTHDTHYPTLALTLNFVEAALGCVKNIRLASGRIVRVKFDAGITHNQKVRLHLPDDNIVMAIITVTDHKIFTRKGLDVYLTALVHECDWNKKTSIPTIYGKVTMKILPGYLHKNIRLKHKGIRLADGRCGDQYVYVKKAL